MATDTLDRTAIVAVMVEMASRLTPEELFETLTQIAARLGDRIDLKGLAERPGPDRSLAKCLRTCLSAHGLAG